MSENNDREYSSVEETSMPSQDVSSTERKPKNSKTTLVLTILLVVALIACAVLAWLWYDQSKQVETLKNDVSEKTQQITKLEAEQKENSQTQQTSESEVIINTTLAYVSAPLSAQGKSFTATILKQKNGFASVSVAVKGASGAAGYFLKKSNGIWVVIGDSTDNIDTLSQTYGLPKDIM